MSLTHNKQLATHFIEQVFNKKDISVAHELLADNFIDRTPAPGFGSDKVSHVKMFETFFTAIPDLKMNIDDLICEGEKVVIRHTITGTHQGQLAYFLATGNSVCYEGITILRIVNGKLTEHWAVNDDLKLLEQIGVVQLPSNNEK